MNFGTALITYSMGETKWRSLPEDIRKVLTEAGATATREACKQLGEMDTASAEKVKAAGMKVISFSDADRAEFYKIFDQVSGEWAAELDRRGKPGRAVAAAFKKAVAANKQP